MFDIHHFYLPGIGEFLIERDTENRLTDATNRDIQSSGDGQTVFYSGDLKILYTPEEWFTAHGTKPEAPEYQVHPRGW